MVFYLQHYYLGFTLASKMKVSKDVQHTLWLLACLSDFLGVTIDNSLSWKQHVNILSSSLGRRVGILARLRHILPQHCLGTIYNNTIQTLIDYGLSVWGHSSAYNINLIQRYQNRAARLVSSNFNYDKSSLNIVQSLKWLNVKERCIYFTNNK